MNEDVGYDEIRPSWEVFLTCRRCGAGDGEPCRKLNAKVFIEARNPHPYRRKKPRGTC